MGHVDHGKTRLLDAIRQAKCHGFRSVAALPRISGAYQWKIDGKKVTFL
jgi:translation initiation factor IF-2